MAKAAFGRARLRRLVAGGLSSLALLLAACGTGGAVTTQKPAAGGTQPAATIKVGFLAPTSGTAAAPGHDMINGWKMWWSQHGDTVAGHKVETIYYDTASNPNTALTQARKAVEQDGVKLVVGPYLANEGLAVAPYMEEHKTPLVLPTVSADDLTQRKPSPYVIRVAGWSSSQTTHPAGVWAYEQGYRKAVTIGNAYAFSYESVGGFAQTFSEKGGQILKQLWTPLGTTDFSPYLSQVQAEKPDVVFVCLAGADNTHLLEQWSAFGLMGKLPLVAQETLTDQSSIRTLPPKDVLGIVTFAHYAEGRDDPATQTFVQAYEKAYSVLPSYMAAAFYTSAQWLSQALEQVHGDVTNQEGFLNAVHAVKLDDSPLGPMSLDKYGNPIQNVYIRKAVPTPAADQDAAKVWNVVTQTYPNVSQFWTYNPDQYLKQPVYSDTFQGIGK